MSNSESIYKVRFEDYLLMFILLGISGNPAFGFIGGKYIYLIVVVILLFLWGNRITTSGWQNSMRWALILLIIFIGQYFTLNAIGYLASANYIFKVISAILIVSILGDPFSVIYLKTMYYVSIIGLILWTFNVFGVILPTFIHFPNHSDSIIIYTQMQPEYHMSTIGILRNCGMFWEPGAYSGYLLVAPFLFINKLDHLWYYYKRETVVLILALVSTFSTTGYIVFAFLVLFFLGDRIRNKASLYITGIIAIGVAIWLYNDLNFMGEKIREQYEAAIAMDKYDVNFSRMGALVFDWQYIKMHPLFGNGLIDETRFSQHISFAENLSAFGNGFSGEIAYFGIPFMLFYLFSVFRNPSLKKKLRLLILLILTLQGEYYLNYPLFFIFPFVTYF